MEVILAPIKKIWKNQKNQKKSKNNLKLNSQLRQTIHKSELHSERKYNHNEIVYLNF